MEQAAIKIQAFIRGELARRRLYATDPLWLNFKIHRRNWSNLKEGRGFDYQMGDYDFIRDFVNAAKDIQEEREEVSQQRTGKGELEIFEFTVEKRPMVQSFQVQRKEFAVFEKGQSVRSVEECWEKRKISGESEDQERSILEFSVIQRAVTELQYLQVAEALLKPLVEIVEVGGEQASKDLGDEQNVQEGFELQAENDETQRTKSNEQYEAEHNEAQESKSEDDQEKNSLNEGELYYDNQKDQNEERSSLNESQSDNSIVKDEEFKQDIVEQDRIENKIDEGDQEQTNQSANELDNSHQKDDTSQENSLHDNIIAIQDDKQEPNLHQSKLDNAVTEDYKGEQKVQHDILQDNEVQESQNDQESKVQTHVEQQAESQEQLIQPYYQEQVQLGDQNEERVINQSNPQQQSQDYELIHNSSEANSDSKNSQKSAEIQSQTQKQSSLRDLDQSNPVSHKSISRDGDNQSVSSGKSDKQARLSNTRDQETVEVLEQLEVKAYQQPVKQSRPESENSDHADYSNIEQENEDVSMIIKESDSEIPNQIGILSSKPTKKERNQQAHINKKQSSQYLTQDLYQKKDKNPESSDSEGEVIHSISPVIQEFNPLQSSDSDSEIYSQLNYALPEEEMELSSSRFDDDAPKNINKFERTHTILTQNAGEDSNLSDMNISIPAINVIPTQSGCFEEENQQIEQVKEVNESDQENESSDHEEDKYIQKKLSDNSENAEGEEEYKRIKFKVKTNRRQNQQMQVASVSNENIISQSLSTLSFSIIQKPFVEITSYKAPKTSKVIKELNSILKPNLKPIYITSTLHQTSYQIQIKPSNEPDFHLGSI